MIRDDRGWKTGNPASPAYDDLYVKYLYYFNVERDYFECHEVLEALWLEEGRSTLYQGLLQVAVGLYHYRNGNNSGSIKLFTSAIEKLSPYPDTILGIALGKLVAECRTYLRKVERAQEEPFEFYDMDITIIDPQLIELVGRYIDCPPEPHEED